ncbi:MAG TPA: hypothetical protein VJU78_20605 [Chitinophagaceae bacterium]|nr:hypothetical protein [Chitinophagaceae bacterium]
MNILFYSTKNFERRYLATANRYGENIVFIEEALDLHTIGKTNGFDVVSIFTGDDGSSAVLEALK